MRIDGASDPSALLIGNSFGKLEEREAASGSDDCGVCGISAESSSAIGFYPALCFGWTSFEHIQNESLRLGMVHQIGLILMNLDLRSVVSASYDK